MDTEEHIHTLEQRLKKLATNQEEINRQLEEEQKLLDQLRTRQIKAGPLGPLAQALAYHHKMVNGWAYLASEGGVAPCTPENYSRLYIEFVKMRQVVIEYEYVTQCLLGIDPSPFADLEDK